MANIESPFWLWIKGGLFVAIGCLCLVFVAMVTQSVQVVAVCCLAIWAFCRAYYFAFYVIENYIDPKFRFAGLLSVLGYFVDKDQVRTEDVAQNINRKDTEDKDVVRNHVVRKDIVLANAHQVWLAIACWSIAYPYLPIPFTDMHRVNEFGLMIHVGMYASFLGTLAFWAVFCAMPLAYRTSIFIVLVGLVGLSTSLIHQNGKVSDYWILSEYLISVCTYSLMVWVGFLFAAKRFRRVLASCHTPKQSMQRKISIRFLLAWMCVISFACVVAKWIPISLLNWGYTLFAIAELVTVVPFYIVINLILARAILQTPSSQSPQRLLLYIVLWFAVSQACVLIFSYSSGIPYDRLDFEVPILFMSCLFFQVLLFLFLRMAGERLISIDSLPET